MVYTTNSIENLNRQIRKVTKTKVTFEKESNMLDLIFMVIKDFEAINWQKYPVSNFQNFRKKHNQRDVTHREEPLGRCGDPGNYIQYFLYTDNF